MSNISRHPHGVCIRRAVAVLGGVLQRREQPARPGSACRRLRQPGATLRQRYSDRGTRVHGPGAADPFGVATPVAGVPHHPARGIQVRPDRRATGCLQLGCLGGDRHQPERDLDAAERRQGRECLVRPHGGGSVYHPNRTPGDHHIQLYPAAAADCHVAVRIAVWG